VVLQEALAVAHAAGSRRMEACTGSRLALLAPEAGEHARAAALAADALRNAVELGMPALQSGLVRALGAAALAEGRPAEALARLAEATVARALLERAAGRAAGRVAEGGQAGLPGEAGSPPR
jgi:hypothetical protein